MASFPNAKIIDIRTAAEITADAELDALPEVEDEWDPSKKVNGVRHVQGLAMGIWQKIKNAKSRQVVQMQEEMHNIMVVGEAGAGLVKATCTPRRFKGLEIDPSIFSKMTKKSLRSDRRCGKDVKKRPQTVNAKRCKS